MDLFSILCGSLDGRGDWGRMDPCLRTAESLCSLPETITELFVNRLYPNTNKKLKNTIKKINNKDLLYSRRNDSQYLVITYIGKDSEKGYMCICIHTHIYRSLCSTHETNTTL